MTGLTLFSDEHVRGRSCGSCKACCVQMPIEEINKKANVKCNHLKSNGCGIYKSRPISCRMWSCRWLIDEDTAEIKRPDRAGYIIDTALDTILVDGEPVNALQIWVDPVRRDAHLDPSLRKYLNMMGEVHGLPAIVRWASDECFFLAAPSLTKSRQWEEYWGGSVSPEHMAARLKEARG